MIELKISNDYLDINNIYIKNINHILVNNYHILFDFIRTLLNTTTSQITLGNKKLENKNFVFFNLLDYEAIYNQLQLKKGSLLYEYVIQEIINVANESTIEYDIETLLDTTINNLLNNKTINYQLNFDIDISKLITTFINIKININNKEYLDIIKRILIDYKKNAPNKTIFVLVNVNIFENVLDDIDNIYIFKINDIYYPNIYFGDSIINLDKELMMNHLRLNWPTEINDKDLEKQILYYTSNIAINKIDFYDYEQYITCDILNKLLNIPKEINKMFDFENLPVAYKSYIKDLNSN